MAKFLKLKGICLLACLLPTLAVSFTGCSMDNLFPSSEQSVSSSVKVVEVVEDGTYTSKDEVAAYLNKYGHLPSNYITEDEALVLGWVNTEGNLAEVAPGKSIGGDPIEFIEKTLPYKEGRIYYKCDLDYEKGYRGARRLVYSNDGLIYYTGDHYKTCELLYGEP